MHAATPLIDAIKANEDPTALEILRTNPDAARQKGTMGESALLIAVYYGKPAIAAQIAEHTELDLCEAAALGNASRVAQLLALGAAHDVCSFDGWTPLHLAAFFGNVDAARVLLDSGAQLETISSNSTANTPLCAALAGQAGLEFIRLLVDHGANVNARVAHGLRPLHLAASRGAVDVIALLLSAGAEPED